MELTVQVVDDPAAAALPLVQAAIADAVAQRGRAIVALCGGASPLPLFRSLVHADVPWQHVWVTFGDERLVALQHANSNAGKATETLLSHVPIPDEQVLTWPTEEAPQQAAASYMRLLEHRFGTFPTLDLNLLGLGDDGHTASLFPRTGAVLEPGPTLAVQAPAYATPGGWRLSMSAAALSNAYEVLFLAPGASKRAALKNTFGQHARTAPRSRDLLDAYPARAITARRHVRVITDSSF